MKVLPNKTKIVATIGPASSSKDVLRQMILNGLNVARINFSHGSHEQHKEVIDTVRELNDELNANVGILGDLQGPKIRIGKVENNHRELIDGDTVLFTTNKNEEGKDGALYITYQTFPKDVKAGERILIDDGKIMIEIVETDKNSHVKGKVIHGGPLSSNKGVNLPNTAISLPCLTEKDLKDLDFVIKENLSWVALSFVRNKADIDELRAIINKSKKDIRIIAKIEKPEAVENIEEIIEATDGCMVARGDLGVEIPMQDVPLLQKRIVKMCRKASKPVIIATQMMESMITNISPTRAEVNDVANAVLDSADAVMLSGETSVGKYPIDVIKAMCKIIGKMEESDSIYYKSVDAEPDPQRFVSDIICENATRLAKKGGAKAIVTMSFSGYTGFKISSHRPKSNVYVFSANKRILNTMSLVWGAKAFHYDKFVSTDHTVDDIRFLLKEEGYIKEGDIIINIASMPIESKGMSNMMKMTYA